MKLPNITNTLPEKNVNMSRFLPPIASGLFWLFMLTLLLLPSSCGDTSQSSISGSGEYGSLAPVVVWDIPPELTGLSSKVSGVQKSKTRLKAPANVYSLLVIVYDSNNNPIPSLQTTKNVTPGESGTITIGSVPVGTVGVLLEGKDAGGTSIYGGLTSGVTVATGATATPTVTIRYYGADSAAPAATGHSPTNGATNVSSISDISIHITDADAGVDFDSITLRVNGTDVRNSIVITGASDDFTITYTPPSLLSGTVSVSLDASDMAAPGNNLPTQNWSFNIATGGNFTSNGNGTVTDNVTGLMWQQEDDNTTRLWAAAGTYCGALSLGGHANWRLPTKKELMTIVNYDTRDPSIDATFFPNTNVSSYWSATTYVSNTIYAWNVYFNRGSVVWNSKQSSSYVRCVR